MYSRVQKTICRCAMGVVGAAILSLTAVQARGGIMLFTTQEDFNLFASSSTTTVAASGAYDYDASTINGAGNNHAGGPGAAGTAGSLQLTEVSPTAQLGYSYLCTIGNVGTNSAFMNAIDPGSTTAYTAATSYGPGATALYAASIALTYTIPTSSSGNYFQMGINLNYDGNNFAPKFGAAVNDGTVGGFSTYTVTIPYTINPHSLTNFNFDLRSNSNYVLTSPFYVDSIQVIPPVAVPEPASMLGLTVAAGSLLLRRRSQI